MKVVNELKKKNIRPWMDEEQIPPGTSYVEAVGKAISRMRSAVIFIGPNGLGPNQERETNALYLAKVERQCRTIVAILSNCIRKPAIPELLRDINHVDFRKPEPNPFEQLVKGITWSGDDQNRDLFKSRRNEPDL
jgi:hypothetical protein